MSQDDLYYAALLARDYRFDGKFFVGVKTTGIYCRPICPARPLRKNVEFFKSALAAEKKNYRPCLRCRPEAAPRSPAWFGTSAIVQRALRSLSNPSSAALDEEEFAAQFGVSARHLRRLFETEVGQTPKQISDLSRLNFARQLVVETPLPMTEIALTSGFASLRRFNDAFRKRFQRAPSLIRKSRKKEKPSGASPALRLSLSYRPPYDWKTLLAYYRSHRIGGVERVTDTTYERAFRLGDQIAAVRVHSNESAAKLEVEVLTHDPKTLFGIAQTIRQMFDLDSDPLLLANQFAESELFGGLVVKYPGLRIPRSFSVFEGILTTVLGQLVSVEQASVLTTRLVEAYGEKIADPFDATGGGQKTIALFPTPAALAEASLEEIGTTRKRKETIREVARRVLTGKLSISPDQSPEAFKAALRSIPGIGAWSAEYIAIRALGDTDSFPASDLILKRALEMHPALELESLRPWRAYAAFYLWKEYAQVLKKQALKKTKSPPKTEKKK